MKWAFIHIILFLGSFVAVAQPKENKARLITTFPFMQLLGGVILIEARFDTISKPFNFILDTGSGGISLDSNTVEEFQIENVPSNVTIQGIGGIRKVNFVHNKRLILPGLTVDSLDFHINNYDLLSSVYGIKIDGIIGYSFLKHYIVKIDFDKKIIEVFTKGKIKYPKRGTSFYPVFTALPIVPVYMKDATAVTGNVYFDTGAGLCFLLTKRFAEDSMVIKESRRQRTVGVQGMGGKRLMKITILQKVKFGPYVFRKVPTYVLNDELNIISYPFLGGLLGNDLLRRFNIILNYPEKRIHLTPNTHFKDAFDYSYIGMNLYYVEGQIEIQDIIPGSPAEKAGLEEHDVIVAINKNFAGDLSEYKEMFNKQDKHVLIVNRNGELLTFQMKVGRIY